MTYNVFSGTLNPTHFTSLHDCLMQRDNDSFWKSFCQKFHKPRYPYASVVGHNAIANVFAESFASVCTPNNILQSDKLQSEFYRRSEDSWRGNHADDSLHESWHTELGLSKLKCGKAPDADGIMSEWIT